MKAREIAREIFGLVLRLLGVYFFYLAAIGVPSIWRWLLMPGRISWSVVFDNLFVVAWQGAVAWWLVKGAPPVSRWAYSKSDE
jgi:hypothetical protein